MRILVAMLHIFTPFLHAENRGTPRPWVQTSKGVAISATTEKKVYEAGEIITLTVKQTNFSGPPKQFERGYLFGQFKVEVFRNGAEIKMDTERLAGC